MTAPAPRCEIYALRYAYRDESYRGEHFYGHDAACGERMPIDYFAWAVIDGDSVLLVDAGFTRETAVARGKRNYVASPAELLRGIGYEPDQVGTLVLTHLHYDHTGCVHEFPAAQVVVQERELEFWTGPFARRGEFGHLGNPDDIAGIQRLAAAGRLRLLDGDASLTGRVSLHLVGGHTPGMQVVRVATPDAAVVLASDSTHFFENVEQDRPYGVVYQLRDVYAAFDRVRDLASPGWVVPGHDPLVATRFPAVPGLEDRVFRII